MPYSLIIFGIFFAFAVAEALHATLIHLKHERT